MSEIAVIISLVSLVIALTTVNIAHRVKHNPPTRYRRSDPQCSDCHGKLNNRTRHNCKGHHNG